MPVDAIILFVFSIFISIFLILPLSKLKSNYNINRINYYFNFLFITILYGFLNWVGPHLVFWTFDNVEDFSKNKIILIFILFAIPLLLIKFYLFVKFLFSFVMVKIKSIYLMIYIIFSIFIFFVLLIGIKGYFDYGDNGMLRKIFLLLGLVFVIAEYVVILFSIYKSYSLKKRDYSKFVSSLGWLYFSGYFIYIISAYSVYLVKSQLLFQLTPYFYFLIHIPPLLLIRQYFLNLYKHQNFSYDLSDSIFAKNNISNREKEIILQILEGKNNEDIGNTLFISPHTVRNHIYNIYKKIGVKNKVQLSSFFNNSKNTLENNDID